MKRSVALLFFVTFTYSDKCPPGQYKPGPECMGTDYRIPEPICPPPSIHSAPIFSCDCWCNPGTLRNVRTRECVSDCSDAWT